MPSKWLSQSKNGVFEGIAAPAHGFMISPAELTSAHGSYSWSRLSLSSLCWRRNSSVATC